MCGVDKELIVKTTKPSSRVAAVTEATREIDSTQNHHQTDAIVNLDHGDPTMYESYWKNLGEECQVRFHVNESLSYFANAKSLCWFLEPKLEQEIKAMHKFVGNAITEDRYIIVGTGSSQLIQAALYALSVSFNETNPVSVVSPAPYYSCYPEMCDLLRSGLFKWAGDACSFEKKEEAYIEVVTSPNNPDGHTRESVVNGTKGMAIHDFAYYWPQYTAITSPADHDIMLFTLSKFTGHAGSRIGWALVKDKEVAKRMMKYIEVNSIGVSKEAQLRAANVLEMVSLSSQKVQPGGLESFFEYSQRAMMERWKRLRDAVDKSKIFHVAKFPVRYCNFFGDFTESYPAFAWLKCKDGMNCRELLRDHNIIARSGERFGSGEEYCRVSMLGRYEEFDLFVQRLSAIHSTNSALNLQN